jgi:uncharacterized membrane protein
MTLLILGLAIFLGMHSIHMLAPNFREAGINKLGLWGWKGLFAVISIVGFVLLVMGYGEARQDPTWLYQTPNWTRHLVALLMIPAMILLVAAYIPGNRLKARMGHPMLLATKIWALAHLFANGGLHDVILFGVFLAWAVADFIVNRKRDRAAGKTYPVAGIGRDIAVVVVGLGLYVAFVMKLHVLLMGVPPFTMG